MDVRARKKANAMSENQPAVSLLQPPLSHVMNHLQPNLAECILGTDTANLRLVHLSMRSASPLLIQGDPALGTVDLVISLLVQLYVLNDPSHLRVFLLDPSRQLASLVQFLPQTCAVAIAERDLPGALSQAGHAAGEARPTGATSPLVLVVVNQFLGLRSDANAWGAFRALVEHGREQGIGVIALSSAGDSAITAHSRLRIAFASEHTGAAVGSEFFEEQAMLRLQAAHQRGQFLVEGGDVQGVRQLVLPLIDCLALHADDQKGVTFLHCSLAPTPIACTLLEGLARAGGQREPVKLFEALAAHVRACSRCRHGLLKHSDPFPAIAPLSCSACNNLLPTYYEATHPDHPQVSMPAADLVRVAHHLGQCPACCEIWGTLVQLSMLEEEENP